MLADGVRLMSIEDGDAFTGSGADRVTGAGGENNFYLGAGHDLAFGNGGTDYLYGEAGNGSLDGGADLDKLYGGDGDDELDGGGEGPFGGTGTGTGTGADALGCGAGDDFPTGGAGDDLLIGGAGDDLLGRSEGADVFRFGSGWANDSIADFSTSDDHLDLRAFNLTEAQLEASITNNGWSSKVDLASLGIQGGGVITVNFDFFGSPMRELDPSHLLI